MVSDSGEIMNPETVAWSSMAIAGLGTIANLIYSTWLSHKRLLEIESLKANYAEELEALKATLAIKQALAPISFTKLEMFRSWLLARLRDADDKVRSGNQSEIGEYAQDVVDEVQKLLTISLPNSTKVSLRKIVTEWVDMGMRAKSPPNDDERSLLVKERNDFALALKERLDSICDDAEDILMGGR